MTQVISAVKNQRAASFSNRNVASLREGHQLQFRTELFNAFNTPQFANPGGTLGTGTFGRITSTALDNRQIQFALKYMF
jgi:adhesin HecA-like repeat protein